MLDQLIAKGRELANQFLSESFHGTADRDKKVKAVALLEFAQTQPLTSLQETIVGDILSALQE